MTLTIRPDPARPAGGHAILRFDTAAGVPAEVTVAVLETFGGRWLAPSAADAGGRIGIGDANWQAARHDFGPYPVQAAGGGADIAIGPEIVNKIDGYTLVRIVAGPLEGQASWPDDVIPLAGATGRVGLQVLRKAAVAEAEPALMRREAVPDPAPATPLPDPEATVILPRPVRQDPAPAPRPERRRGPLLAGLAVLVLLLAGAAGWFLTRPDPVPPPAPVAVLPPPVPEAPEPEQAGDDGCSVAALTALAGFAAQRDAVAACGDGVSGDALLGLIETAAAGGDAAALLLFGTLYDAAVTDAVAEARLGLTFGDIPAQAAEYYARAAASGAAEARPLLAATCARLATATDTLSKGAHDDFCR